MQTLNSLLIVGTKPAGAGGVFSQLLTSLSMAKKKKHQPLRASCRHNVKKKQAIFRNHLLFPWLTKLFFRAMLQ